MKRILTDDNLWILRFDNGEDILQGLIEFARENKITAGWFSAIGACKRVELRFYNPESKEYEPHDIEQALEIVSMTGNLGVLNGEIAIHTHGAFSDKDFMVKAGHIAVCVVSATAEVYLKVFSGTIERELDLKTCLNLMR